MISEAQKNYSTDLAEIRTKHREDIDRARRWAEANKGFEAYERFGDVIVSLGVSTGTDVGIIGVQVGHAIWIVEEV